MKIDYRDGRNSMIDGVLTMYKLYLLFIMKIMHNNTIIN